MPRLWALGSLVLGLSLAACNSSGDCVSTYYNGIYCTCVILPTPTVPASATGCSPNYGASCDPTINNETVIYPLPGAPNGTEICGCARIQGGKMADGGPSGFWNCVFPSDGGTVVAPDAGPDAGP
jgi:hypothetical protein